MPNTGVLSVQEEVKGSSVLMHAANSGVVLVKGSGTGAMGCLS